MGLRSAGAAAKDTEASSWLQKKPVRMMPRILPESGKAVSFFFFLAVGRHGNLRMSALLP